MKTIINPIIPMKNTGGISQDCKINLEIIRTASSRQQLSKLNFKVIALRSSNTFVTGEENLGKICLSLLFLITTYGCMCESERDDPFHRALKKPAPFQNDGHLRGLRAPRPVSKDNPAAMHLATSAASPPLRDPFLRERKNQWRKSCFLAWASPWE